MTSTLQAGKRCRTNRWVTSYAGKVEPRAEGKIRYVSENLGRFLVLSRLGQWRFHRAVPGGDRAGVGDVPTLLTFLTAE